MRKGAMLTGETTRSPGWLQAMFAAGGRQLRWWQMGANLIGACTVMSYFVFFDQVFSVMRIRTTFYVVAVMFPLLAAIAAACMHLGLKDLALFFRMESQAREIDADLRKCAQRKILNLPLMSALISLFNWLLAAITMTTYGLISQSDGTEGLPGELITALRVFVGCIIGGIVVAAIVFFITEAKCRKI
jgi:hypothetical protein